MEKSNQIDMLHGPLIKKLVVFAIPLAICSIIQQLFNSADAAVVGRYVGSDALAAVGATAPVVNLIVGLFVGLSVGANVLIAVQIGSGQEEKIPDSVHTVVVISLVSGIFLMIVGALLANPLLALISTPQDVLGEATLYLQIFFVSMPFSMMYNFGSAILRSKGDSKRPLYALAVGCLVNLLLDLLFVCVFGWGVAGAALATVIGFAVSCVMISLYLMHEEETFRLHWNKLRVDVPDLKYILKIGVPAGIQGMVFAISNVIIQAALNGFGADTIAGSTAGLNYEVYCYFIINAFSQAAVTFTGQNYAALSFDRCRKIYRECTILGLSIAFAMGLTFVGFGDFFTSIFTTNPAAQQVAIVRMMHVALLEFLTGTYEISGGSMRGMGWSMTPAAITIAGTCVFRIIWIYTVFQQVGTFEMLVTVYPVSWIITGVATLVAFAYVRKKAFRGPAPEGA